MKPASRDSGFVLMCVMWILAILTVVTLGFGHRALLDVTGARYSMDYAKAMQMARGAVQHGMVVLRNRAIIDWYNQEDGPTGLGQDWAHPVDMLKEGGYYELGSGQNSSEFKDEVCFYIVQDEESKINLNSAPREILENVESLRNSDVADIIKRRPRESLSPSITDDEETVNFHNVEELRFMLDRMKDETWYGDDRHVALKDMLTCWGGGQINVNTASEAVLKCIPDISNGTLGSILAYRAGSDNQIGTHDDLAFASIEDLCMRLEIKGKQAETLAKYCTCQSQFFTITGVATLRQGKVRACCRATVQGAYILQWREEPVGS